MCSSSSLENPRCGNCVVNSCSTCLSIMKRLPRYSRQFVWTYRRLSLRVLAVRWMSVPKRCASTVLPVPMSPVMSTLGLVVPGFSMTDRNSSVRNRSCCSRCGSRGGRYSRLSGSSFLKMLGCESVSRSISTGVAVLGRSIIIFTG